MDGIYFPLLRIWLGDLLLYMHWADSFRPVLTGSTWYQLELIGSDWNLVGKIGEIFYCLAYTVIQNFQLESNWIWLEPLGHSKDLNKGHPYVCWHLYDELTSAATIWSIGFTTTSNRVSSDSGKFALGKHSSCAWLCYLFYHLYWFRNTGGHEHKPSGDQSWFAGYGDQQTGKG